MRELLPGILFALLWASASTATKIGLQVGEPLVLTNIRFVIAACIMLGWAHGWQQQQWPRRADWGPLALYGLLNCALYLGLFSMAMREVTAGIGTLGVGLSPLLISALSALLLRQHTGWHVWAGLLLGFAGVAVAVYPNLVGSTATVRGVLTLGGSMLSYALGTVYYASRKWEGLPRLVINGWQILFSALMLLPFTFWYLHPERNHPEDVRFWGAIFWLVIPVSIGAVQLWLFLLRHPVRASFWLFLCPIIGFLYARVLLGEPLTVYTAIGTILVLTGLYIGRRTPAIAKTNPATTSTS